ncbi:MAG: cysteine rich repeat-containing protein [Lysobacterales bacterium]
MKSIARILFTAVAVFLTSQAAFAQDDPVDMVMTGCASEIEQYCSQVTLGEGRLLACFFAHEDKLSGQCQYALYQASAQLEQAVNALIYLATECEQDIMTHCAAVEAGEGRILECLQTAGDAVSAACTTAINEVVEFE